MLGLSFSLNIVLIKVKFLICWFPVMGKFALLVAENANLKIQGIKDDFLKNLFPRLR